MSKKVVRRKDVGFPKDVFDMLENESEVSLINMNTICVVAVREFIERRREERKKKWGK